MKRVFVNTENARRFLAGLDALEKRGAEEACLMVVDGHPGLGKTWIIERWATQTGSPFLRAKAEWRPNWFLSELIKVLGGAPLHSFERRYAQALELLSGRQQEAERTGEAFAVVIDEVDHISRSQKILESIRDLSDMLEFPFILVGMGKVRHHLTRFPQIASRVGQYVQFENASLEDARLLADQLCEVPIHDDLASLLHRHSGGKIREIKEGLARIERLGKVKGGGEVTLADMEGKTLLNDRKSGKAIVVRAA